MGFQRSVKLWATKVKKRENALIRKLVTFSHKSLVELTPIDTGRAKASWRVAVGRPDLSVDTRGERGTLGFGLSVAVGAVTSLRQFAAASTVTFGGKDVWLTNNLHYIGLLEREHSSQSAWMLRTTFGRAVVAWPGMVAAVKGEIR